MDIGRFHLELLQFAAQVVNFLIIAWVINRFLLRPLMANMKARREKIARGLADADETRAALEEAARERDRILQEASAEAFRLLQNARDEAERLRAASRERASHDAERMIEEARGVMALERQDMEKAVQGLSLRLSGKILEKVVQGLFSEEERARYRGPGHRADRESGRLMKRLVALALAPDGQVNDEVAIKLLSQLSRSDLKKFLAALRIELKKRIVQVTVAGRPGPALGQAVARNWPGRRLDVETDDSLGAGVKVSAGDDIVDASVHGYVREMIEELGST